MIRPATLADVPAIVEMGRQFYATTHYTRFCSEPDLLPMARTLIDHVCLIAEVDGKPVGMVGLMLIPFLFNPAQGIAAEVMWYVDPASQGSGVGKSLLAAVEPACKARGVAALQMIHLASSPPEAGALYARMGLEPSETSWMKVL